MPLAQAGCVAHHDVAAQPFSSEVEWRLPVGAGIFHAAFVDIVECFFNYSDIIEVDRWLQDFENIYTIVRGMTERLP